MTKVQFEITGVCPVEGGEVPEGMTLPVTVWVHCQASIPVPYSHEMCDGLHYRMIREDAQRFGANWEGVFVCEHMGRLIE